MLSVQSLLRDLHFLVALQESLASGALTAATSSEAAADRLEARNERVCAIVHFEFLPPLNLVSQSLLVGFSPIRV